MALAALSRSGSKGMEAVEQELSWYRQTTQDFFVGMEKHIGRADRGAQSYLKKEQDRIQGILDRLEVHLARMQADADEALQRHILLISEFLFPRRKLQERILNPLQIFYRHGPEVFSLLGQVCREHERRPYSLVEI
jgi:uncharacterized protein YllA (UPF0747 family)